MTRPRPPLAAVAAASAAGLTAVALGSIPWIAGSITVVQPDAARLVLVTAAIAGFVSIGVAVLTRRVHPALRGTVLSLGLLAAASSPAFVELLARQQPAEPRLVGQPAKADSTTGADRLRVLQLNAYHGYPDREGRLLPPAGASDRLVRAGRLADAINHLRPDIVVLQEAWCTVAEGCLADRLAEALDLQAVYARANGSLRWLGFEEGSAILSRFPIADPATWPLLPDRDRFERRIALSARIEHPALPFHVVGVHAANGDPELAGAQTEHLLERILSLPARPALIAGDFNLESGHPALGRFDAAGYRDLLPGGIDHVLLDAEASGWWPLWSEWPPALPDTAISDHPGLLVEFQLPAPPPDDDWPGEWQLVPADQVGLDADRLEQTIQDIGELEGLHGLLIARHGRLVAERYFRGSAGHRLHNLKSASKSVLSALAGLAVEEGVLELDQPIAEVLSEAADLDDPRKQAITVRHLLTMTSGLESTSFGNYGSWVASRNWVRAALARPLRAEPGTRFSYSTGGTHLLSASLARAAGQSTHDFAREHLFGPLGIRRSAWARDRQGVHMGGNNLSLLPRDMLTFGQLYLNRGRWGGEQLLPWQWVDRSTRPGLVGPRGRGRIYGGYGYLWWLRGSRERSAYIASGYGGQYIYVSPAEDLVVVTISTEISKGRGWRGELFGMIRAGIAGSVVDPYERRGRPAPL
ncbi:MAG: serine hydrolase [Acidobacteria bacterium]|nr:serine hydrolase [Acidobacteriota bacterium]